MCNFQQRWEQSEMVHSLATSQSVLSPNGPVSGPRLLSDQMYEVYVDLFIHIYV